MISKRLTLRSYVRKLPLLLKKRYGKHKRYSEREIKESIQWAKFNKRYIDYALAIYMSKKDYDHLKTTNTSFGEYDTLRQEIADIYFKGKKNFTVHNLIDISIQSYKNKADMFDESNVDGTALADSDLDGDTL